MQKLSPLIFLFISLGSLAQIYVYVDAKGNKVFSNQPPYYIKPDQVRTIAQPSLFNFYNVSRRPAQTREEKNK